MSDNKKNLTRAIDDFNDNLDLLDKGGADVIAEKIQEVDNNITNKLDEAKNEMKGKINSIPAIKIPEEQKITGNVKVNNIQDINFKPMIRAIEKIKIKESKETKPIEIADYTLLLDEILKILEKPNEQIEKLNILLSEMPTVQRLEEIFQHQKTDFGFDEKGRIKVAVDRVGGSSQAKTLMNASDNIINPATEGKQDNIITEVAKGLIGNTQADGLGTKYNITTDSSGRLHTRSFKNAAGDGRRMLVDSDRHGQIDILTSALPSGAATSAKQDNIITEIEPLTTPVTTALTLTTANTQYLMPASEQANRRTLIIFNKSDTDVYIGASGVTTTTGIELPSGGRMTIDCESGLYAVCGTAGKIINLLEIK